MIAMLIQWFVIACARGLVPMVVAIVYISRSEWQWAAINGLMAIWFAAARMDDRA